MSRDLTEALQRLRLGAAAPPSRAERRGAVLLFALEILAAAAAGWVLCQ